MRALAYAATLLILLTGAAAAGRQSTTIGGVRIDLDLPRATTLVEGSGGVVLTERYMPSIWLGAYGEPCPPTDQPLELPRPTGFHVAASPPAVSPWPQRMSWTPLCIEGDGVTVHVLIQYFDYFERSIANQHVQSILQALVVALRPPLEIVPRVSIDRTTWGPLLRPGSAPGQFLFQDQRLEISLDRASCRGLPEAPPGTRQVCRELPDRALVLSYRELPGTAGEPPPPAAGEPPPPSSPDAPPPPSSPDAPPPPSAARAPGASRAEIDRLVDEITRAIVNEYGSAIWLEKRTVQPSWANGELPLSKLPPGTWKLSDRRTIFELHEIESRTHITIAHAACAAFWAGLPPGRRIEAPSFLPAAARAAVVVVDERERWRAVSCFSLLDTDVTVTIDSPRAPDPATAHALAGALTEVTNANRFTGSISVGAAGSGSLGVFFEGWTAGRVSGVAQLEVIDPGTDGDGKLESFRLGLGFGPGFSRKQLRAAVHAGIALEQAPMQRRDGEDHMGGSLFLDARAIAGAGPFVVQGIARGAYYFDIDCTDTDDEGELCGESDHSDHTPELGWELEGRVGITPRRRGWRIGGYLGLRYVAVWTGDRLEHGVVGTIGSLTW